MNEIKGEFYLIKLLKKIFVLLYIIIIINSSLYLINNFKIIDKIKNLIVDSNFIEENYVEVKHDNLKFDKKRNLIHIVLESVETSMSSKENGGAFDNNYIPKLTELSKEYTSFSTSIGGGYKSAPATGWTVASLVAQTSGIPLYTKRGLENSMGTYDEFLPGVYSLGEILEKEGYNQTFLLGSSSSFGGRDKYFTQHGNYKIKDYDYAIKKGLIPSDYHVFWGYEDSKLYKFAKDELKNLSNKDEPFNLTMLTVNTHFTDGYYEDYYEKKFDTQYENVIYNSDKDVYNFVKWIMKQDFYKDTTIVITGDHPTMQNSFFDNVDKNYQRTVYNVFINSAVKPEKENNRLFYTMDMFPTILASMGVQIKDNRLALGTNLFSKEKTFYEEYGEESVDKQLSSQSGYYYKKFY